jgi:hypothetical protein
MPPQPKASPAVLFLTRLVAGLAVVCFIVYAVDFSWYHLRLAAPTLGVPTSSVHRLRMLAIPEKGNRIEYQLDETRPEEDLPCTRTLFPHSSEQPCWYVSRHANDPISM